jgi:hypothetical protein
MVTAHPIDNPDRGQSTSNRQRRMSIPSGLECLKGEEEIVAKYLYLIHHKPGAYDGLSPDAMQAIVARYRTWVQRLKESGAYLASEKLGNDGRVLRRDADQGRLRVSDGPYVESKELVAGFYLIEAPDYEHAVELARDCPVLERGTLEVREILGG